MAAAGHRRGAAGSGPVAHLAPKRAWSCLFNPTVTPAGHVTVLASMSMSMSKSSRLNPPAIAVRSGGASMTAVLPSSSRWARSSPLPYALSPKIVSASGSPSINPGATDASEATPEPRSHAVTSPVSGSTETWALKPSR